MTATPTTRLIVVPVIRGRDGSLLICKMPPDRGVFPGQWALPGGGVEPGERILDALRREIREELGVELDTAHPLFFTDLLREKVLPGGERQMLYMVFLLFDCTVTSAVLRLNDEFTEYVWVQPEALAQYDLNSATRDTFRALGLLQPESTA